MKIILLLGLFLIQIIWVYSTLEQVHVLFRHGARTPGKDNMYPTDPHLNDTWYPYGVGALTNKGKLSMYNIGRDLRNRYDKFLGDIYYESDVYARSTSYARTKMSLEMILAGLYPPAKDQQWGSLDWQPIPLDFVPYKDDKLLGFPIYYCQDLIDEYARISNSEEVQNYLKEHEADLEYINNATGLNTKNTLDILTLYMGLASESEEVSLPDWAAKVYPVGFATDGANYEYKIQTSSDLLIKANGGPLVKKILEDMDKKISNTTTVPKIFLYVAHEYNVAYVLSLLGSFTPHVPTFGTHVTFELHREDGKYAIKIWYMEDGSEYMITLPGCEEKCELSKFREIIAKYLPEKDWCW